MKYFIGDFDSEEDVVREFRAGGLGDLEVRFAYYTYEHCEGTALVILKDRKTGQIYEVNGSHCSCYGLEDQWDLEETTVEALRAYGFRWLEDEHRAKLFEVLEALEAEAA